MSKFEADPKKYGMEPEFAQRKLKDMGYNPEIWNKLLDNKLGSHPLRALIVIAQGTEPQLWGKVSMDIREEDGLPRDRLSKLLTKNNSEEKLI